MSKQFVMPHVKLLTGNDCPAATKQMISLILMDPATLTRTVSFSLQQSRERRNTMDCKLRNFFHIQNKSGDLGTKMKASQS